MEKQYKFLEYKITTDTDFLDKENHLTPYLKNKLQKLHKKALKGDLKMVNTFYELIQKFPKNPQLKNYLSTLYASSGDSEKAFEINHWILTEHPNYLFGKINMANEYYLKEMYEKIPEILGEYMEIQMLYPERKVFQMQEVLTFFGIAIKYFSAIRKFKEAELRLNILEQIDTNGDYYEDASKTFFLHLNLAAMERMEEEEESRIEVKCDVSKNKYKQTTKKPVFIHKEIEQIYLFDIDIKHEILDAILTLPKETLQQDLEKVLIDSLSRYDYYIEKEKNEGYNTDEFTFVVHALFLLKEIGATSSLPIILEVLRQDEIYIELFINEFLTENIWEVLFVLGKKHLNLYENFMREEGVYTYSKSAVLSAVAQFYFHEIISKDIILNWHTKIIKFYLKADIEDNVIDSSVNGFIVNNLLDFKAKELLLLIQQLYDKNYVDLFACGNFEDVKKEMKSDENLDGKIPKISDIYEIYTSYTDFEIEEDYTDNEYNEYIDTIAGTIINETKKVGRNEPCPCGSRKKYKKCCLNK